MLNQTYNILGSIKQRPVTQYLRTKEKLDKLFVPSSMNFPVDSLELVKVLIERIQGLMQVESPRGQMRVGYSQQQRSCIYSSTYISLPYEMLVQKIHTVQDQNLHLHKLLMQKKDKIFSLQSLKDKYPPIPKIIYTSTQQDHCKQLFQQLTQLQFKYNELMDLVHDSNLLKQVRYVKRLMKHKKYQLPQWLTEKRENENKQIIQNNFNNQKIKGVNLPFVQFGVQHHQQKLKIQKLESQVYLLNNRITIRDEQISRLNKKLQKTNKISNKTYFDYEINRKNEIIKNLQQRLDDFIELGSYSVKKQNIIENVSQSQRQYMKAKGKNLTRQLSPNQSPLAKQNIDMKRVKSLTVLATSLTPRDRQMKKKMKKQKHTVKKNIETLNDQGEGFVSPINFMSKQGAIKQGVSTKRRAIDIKSVKQQHNKFNQRMNQNKNEQTRRSLVDELAPERTLFDELRRKYELELSKVQKDKDQLMYRYEKLMERNARLQEELNRMEMVNERLQKQGFIREKQIKTNQMVKTNSPNARFSFSQSQFASFNNVTPQKQGEHKLQEDRLSQKFEEKSVDTRYIIKTNKQLISAHKTLKDKLRECQLQLMKSQTNLQQAEIQLKNLQSQNKQINRQLGQKEVQLSRLYETIKILEKNLSQRDKDISENASYNSKQKLKINSLTEDISNLKQQNIQLTSQTERHQTEITHLQTELNLKQTEIQFQSETKNIFNQQKQTQDQNNIQDLKEQIDKLKKKCNQLIKENKELIKNSLQLENDNDELRRMVETKANKIIEMERNLEMLQNQLKRLESGIMDGIFKDTNSQSQTIVQVKKQTHRKTRTQNK